MKKRVFVLLCLVLLLASPLARADCSFNSAGAAGATIALPATLSVPSDTPNGTVLWSSGWIQSGSFDIKCSGSGVVSGTLAGGIGAAVPGFANAGGYSSVFATSVPGIGISVYWCNMGASSCNTSYNNVTPVPSLAASWGTINVTDVQYYYYNLTSSWWVQLVKTGTIAPGTLSVAGTSSIAYFGLPVASLTVVGNPSVVTLGCQISPTNITVTLPTVNMNDFTGSSPTPGSSAPVPFNIGLTCDSGVQIVYEIDGTQTGTDTNVLANATGSGMAQGIGVQLLQGGPGSDSVMPIGSFVTYGNRTGGSGVVNIPLAARYYRSAPVAGLVPGLVSVTATFTVLYQ